VIAAGGAYLPSAFVTVRLLRHFGCRLPIEIWHAGADEKSPWAAAAFDPLGVDFHDVMEYCEQRSLIQMQGWPIKTAALVHTRFRQILFLDADCFPVRNPEFLFDTPQFAASGALFWPDWKRIKLLKHAPIWQLTGLEYRGDAEFETGLMVLDKAVCWQPLRLAEWMNARSDFWYDHTVGDKDTFYLAWRKLNRQYYLAPPPRRLRLFATRHFWLDGAVADHRGGASKYRIPRRVGPFTQLLAPYKWRSRSRNLVDEVFQRFVISNFTLHARWLRELKHTAFAAFATPARH
jgi:hypothetical protein